MPSRLPQDFDPDWYAATYRDVSLSGLSPREHYVRFGRLLGRPGSAPIRAEAEEPSSPEPIAEPASPTPPVAPLMDEPAPVPARPKVEPASPPALPSVKPKSPPPIVKPKKAHSIIDRPAAFDPLAAVPKPAPLRTGEDGLFSLDNVANLEGSCTPQAAVAQALNAYSRLLRLRVPPGVDGEAEISLGAGVFQTGASRIENAWLTAPGRLRLMLKGLEEGAKATGDLALRAYQADPAAPGDLHIRGQGVQLPANGPVLHDLELRHPLMPLLLELCDSGGATRALALLPFPSLLPGGLHSAELKALQTEPNPMDDFWALSGTLLQEAVGRNGSPPRSVARVSIAGEGGSPFAQEVRDWLSAVFDVAVDRSGAQDSQAAQLLLPRDCVPTISALASRGLRAGGTTRMFGPHLVADAGSYRPRWSIALPPAVDRDGAGPSLNLSEGPADDSRGRETAPIPLAIAIRSPAEPSTNSEPAEIASVGVPPLSIVLDASDPGRAERLVQSMRTAAKTVEWLIRCDDADGDLRLALDRACHPGGWTLLAKGEDLRQAASRAGNEILLTISDRIDVGSGGSLRDILDLLNRDDKAASASCALLAGKIVKRDVVLQPASGGLFPTGVSFASGPRLAFGEPDVLQALPDLAYPVVANTLLFTAWRRSALAGLPQVPATSPSNVEDIRIGLDLLRAGFSNWCTTKVTARLSGPYVARDQIDPVGAGYMQADSWEAILGRVTLVRELF